MAIRGKDMWRLLSGSIDLNVPELTLEDLAYIENILCRDPSLLSSQIKYGYQEQFVFCFVSKSLECTKNKKLCRTNIDLQKKLLSSTLTNRPSLFILLVNYYTHILREIKTHHTTSNTIFYKDYTKVKIFGYCNSCPQLLQQKFEKLNLTAIVLNTTDIDQVLLALIEILTYAYSISLEIYPFLFQNIILLLTTLKDYGVERQILGLKYCELFVQGISIVTKHEEFYMITILEYLSVISKVIRLKLHIRIEDVEALKTISCSIIERILFHIKKSSFVGEAFNSELVSNQLYSALLSVIKVEKWYKTGNNGLLISYRDLLFFLQTKHKHIYSPSKEKCIIIQKLAYDCPIVVCLLYTPFKWRNKENQARNLEFLFQNFFYYLKKENKSLTDLEFFLECSSNISFIQNCKNNAQNLKESEKLVKIWYAFEKEISELHLVSLKLFLKEMISTDLLYEEYMIYLKIKICVSLLQVDIFRNNFEADEIQSTLKFIEYPIEKYFQNISKKNICSYSIFDLSIMSIRTLRSFSPIDIQITKTCAELLKYTLRQKKCNLLPQQRRSFWMEIVKLLKKCNYNNEKIIAVIFKDVPVDSDDFHTIFTSMFCYPNITVFFEEAAETRSFKSQQREEHQEFSNLNMENELPMTSDDLKRIILSSILKDSRLATVTTSEQFFDLNNDQILDVISILLDTQNLSSSFLQMLILSTRVYKGYLPKLINFLLKNVIASLNENTIRKNFQINILKIINAFCDCDCLTSDIFLYFFKLILLYIVHPNSIVTHEALLVAIEVCQNNHIKPAQLWNWYKKDVFILISKTTTLLYLKKGVRLLGSLKYFVNLLGFTCVQEFICKYYRLFMTLFTSHCAKEAFCRGIIFGISRNTRKSIANLFATSFLRIYTYVFLMEESCANQCILIISKCTLSSINELLQKNLKQSVSEVLIHFHRNPRFVKNTFRSLFMTENRLNVTIKYISFIADRFLGILTYFKACLSDQNIEKPLKEEILCSLGKIMKSVGTEYITKFRFKIIAMLEFIMSLNDESLLKLCLKVWNVFVHTVNIQELGSSIIHVAAALQHLLAFDKCEVNKIYYSLIVTNCSVINNSLPGLYFLQNNQDILPAIRERLLHQDLSEPKGKSDIISSLEFFYDQISSPNIHIQGYGLIHMRNLISVNRKTINQLVSNEINVDPVFGKIVECLISSCCHEDVQIQLCSAKCLGELGAIDPSYLHSKSVLENYKQFTLSVNTDDFAILALSELCRIYQLQKGTKYIDNFSLAIQETLSICGISPEENKKLDIWESMSLCMRQIMIPFLTSCYTTSKRKCEYDCHPIFNSNICRSFSDWGFAWASRLIDYVKAEETNHLFNCYKPCMKRDKDLLVFFFPYILIHALLECTEADMISIFEEFESVFTFCELNSSFQSSYNASAEKELTTSRLVLNQLQRDVNHQLCSEEFFVDSSENTALSCSKFCSELLDFLQRWLYERERIYKNSTRTQKVTITDYKLDRVLKFLYKFDKRLVAKANFNASEFARALIYMEGYIAEDFSDRLQENISFLIQIYGELGDTDSVEGAIYIKQGGLSLSEEILFNKVIDRPHQTTNCYEGLMSLNFDQISEEDIKGMIECYLCMETTETALLIADGLWQKLSEKYVDDYFKDCKLELLWRLGQYDALNELLDQRTVHRNRINWSIQCAQTVVIFRLPINLDEIREIEVSSHPNFINWVKKLDDIRINMLSTVRSCLTTKQQLSYPHFYSHTIKLHIMAEVENCKLVLLKVYHETFKKSALAKESEKCLFEMKRFFYDWDLRLDIVQPTAQIIAPILNIRRNLLKEIKRLLNEMDLTNIGIFRDIIKLLDTEIGNLWMRNVAIYRDMDKLQQAHMSLLRAESYSPQILFLEKIKLLWKMGDQTATFKLIEENLQRIQRKYKQNLCLMEDDDRILYAETKFLQASYSAESMSVCAELNLRYFKDAISQNKNNEKCHISLAQYMEKILNSYPKEQKNNENGRKVILEIMLSYAKSLRCGIENVYQSLPRLLTFWFDYTAEFNLNLTIRDAKSASNGPQSVTPEELCRKMNDLICNCSNILPVSMFYTTFSQLLSRICHPSNDVFDILRTILVKLVMTYPHQSLWKLLPTFKSFNNYKVKRCKLILTDSRLGDKKYQKLLFDFNMLIERLIELTNKEVSADQSYEVSALVKQLPQLFKDTNFSKILLPFERFMQISFPIATNYRCHQSVLRRDLYTSHSPSNIPSNPFPHKEVFICNINEELTVLRSAAKPKKIMIQCDDSLQYTVMVKPKDDLRRDFRLMEFNELVKRYLHLHTQARHRRLRIRTYAVVPFNDECGLVEWLPNLNSFRSICTSIYRNRGQGMTDRNLRRYLLPKSDPIENKRRVFLESLLPSHPPVFHEWFRQRFPTPRLWYEARASYIKSVAVMSIVGYILGLGDRHGENILFDEISGDAVHVDFNCLFNQGELFAYPELVPFRLTQNMTFAMGPLKIEGPFRKSCEITLRVLSQASTTLMSMLRPFVYDLVVYNRNHYKQQHGEEITDPKAMVDVRRIDDRLQGFVKKTSISSMPLSVEGHVNFLIGEATNVDNLAAMYIGWGAYL